MTPNIRIPQESLFFFLAKLLLYEQNKKAIETIILDKRVDPGK